MPTPPEAPDAPSRATGQAAAAAPDPAAGRPPSRWRRIVLALWLAAMALGALVATRTHYVADLSAFLPSSPTAAQAVLLEQVQSGIAARLVLVGIEGGTPEARGEASLRLGRALRADGRFETVQNGDNAGLADTGRFLFANRYLLSPSVDAGRFTVDGLRAAIDDTLALLGTPGGALVKSVILRDPTGETVRMAEGMLPSEAPRSDGRVWISRTAPRAVLLATTRAEGGDLDAQEAAQQAIRAAFAPDAAAGLRLSISGAGTFAVESRAAIKHEVERLALAGGVAVVALLLVAFGGSAKALAVALLPVASGVVAGIAAVSLVFGQVHGITLGFGTTLIGEAVDYAIYYLIQARSAPARGVPAASGAARWLAGSWPTVRLGLLTSVCGFAALLFSGFPGLRQLGLFSIAGLAAAALTTRWVLTVTTPDGAPGTGLRARLGRAVGALTGWAPRLRWPLAAATLAAVAVLAWQPSAWRGDLAALSPVGPARMQLDADLRADVGARDSGLLVAVGAPDEAGALAAAEAVGTRLDALVARGTIAGYDSPARLLPSPATQAARQRALPPRDELAHRLAEATADRPLPAARLGAFLDDVDAARRQPLLTRAGLRETPLHAALDALLVPGDGTRPWRALLNLQGGGRPIDAAAVREALAGLPGDVQVVDVGGELRGIYARYLHEARWQALLGALGVVVLLGLHTRSAARLWRIARPVGAAVLLLLATFTLAGTALGILHLVGLLLTVAIGSNYALFFDQLREASGTDAAAADPETLASLALANLTAAISFALLAFSSIPALYAVGEVVAPGIVLCLLLSAAFIPVDAGRPGRPQGHSGRV